MPTIGIIKTVSDTKQAQIDAQNAQKNSNQPPDKPVNKGLLETLPPSLREKVLEVEKTQSGIEKGFTDAGSLPEGLNRGSTTQQIVDYFRKGEQITAEKKRQEDNRARTQWDRYWRNIEELPGSSGVDVVFLPEIGALPIIYGRAKVGGRITAVQTLDNFTHVALPTDSSEIQTVYSTDNYYEKTFVGEVGRITVAYEGNIIYSEIEQAITSSSDLLETGYEANHLIYLPNGAQVTKGLVQVDGDTSKRYQIIFNPPMERARYSINIPEEDVTGTRNKFLIYQQALGYGEMEGVYDVLINGESFHSRQNEARIHYNLSGSSADPLATGNGFPSTNVFTNVAYLTAIFGYNRDTNNYNDLPEISSYVQGLKIHSINRSSEGVYTLSPSREYNNNPALVLLDYLTNSNYGAGKIIKFSSIDLESFHNAARLCDTVVQSNAEHFGRVYNQYQNSYIEGSDFIVARERTDTTPSYTIDEGETVEYSLDLNGTGDTSPRTLDISSFPSSVFTVHTDVTPTSIEWKVIPRIEGATSPLTFSVSESKVTVNVNQLFLNNQERTSRYLDAAHRITDGQFRFVVEAKINYDTDKFIRVRKNLDVLINGENLEWDRHPSYVYSITKDIPLYECNISLSPAQTIRDNIEQILGSMYGGNLIWSEGKWKLSLHYPRSLSDQTNDLSDTITRSEIMTKNFRYFTPNSQDRIGQCTIQFSNEKEDFESDTVVWPPSYGEVHRTYLEEDGQELKANFNFESIKDEYHARARAEQIVRISRTKKTVEFTCSHKYLALENNDLVRVNDTGGVIGFDEVFKFEDMEITNNSFNIKVKADLFDWNNLSWNISDDIAGVDRRVVVPNVVVPVVTNIAYLDTSRNIGVSSGRLTWDYGNLNNVERFVIYIRRRREPASGTGTVDEWNILSYSTTTEFDLPPLDESLYDFGIQVETKTGRKSAIVALEKASVGSLDFGQDGQGVEFLYAVTTTQTAVTETPDDNWGYETPGRDHDEDSNVPLSTMWFISPPEISETHPFLWVVSRKTLGVPEEGSRVTDGWGTPRVTGRWGPRGLQGLMGPPGLGPEYIFATTTDSNAPTEVPDNDWGYQTPGRDHDEDDSVSLSTVWLNTSPSIDATNSHLWRAERKVPGDATTGAEVTDEWSTPSLQSVYGSDGNGVEYIYRQQSTAEVPTTPVGDSTMDGDVPDGWTNNPTGVDEANQWEFISVRKGSSGNWGPFSPPVVWSKFGETGPPGRQGDPGVDGTPVDRGQSFVRIDVNEEQQDRLEALSPVSLPASVVGDQVGPITITNTAYSISIDGVSTNLPNVIGADFIYRRTNSFSSRPATPAAGGNDNDNHTPSGWSRVPTNVTSSLSLEWICYRTGSQGNWSDWQTVGLYRAYDSSFVQNEPLVSNANIQFVFSRGLTDPSVNNPVTTTTEQDNEEFHVPAGWDSRRSGTDSVDNYEWFSSRTRSSGSGVWSKFSTPRIISGPMTSAVTDIPLIDPNISSGETEIEFIFRRTNTLTAPTITAGAQDRNTDGNIPINFLDTPPDATSANPYVWMLQRTRPTSESQWSLFTPGTLYNYRSTIVTGGADVSGVEFVFQTTRTLTVPDRPAGEHTDDFIPEGWSDTPTGVDNTNQFEWASWRRDGSAFGFSGWFPFETPFLINGISAGEVNTRTVEDIANFIENTYPSIEAFVTQEGYLSVNSVSAGSQVEMTIDNAPGNLWDLLGIPVGTYRGQDPAVLTDEFATLANAAVGTGNVVNDKVVFVRNFETGLFSQHWDWSGTEWIRSFPFVGSDLIGDNSITAKHANFESLAALNLRVVDADINDLDVFDIAVGDKIESSNFAVGTAASGSAEGIDFIYDYEGAYGNDYSINFEVAVSTDEVSVESTGDGLVIKLPYDLEDTQRNSKRDIDLLSVSPGNNLPRGMWSDGTTMWVVDGTDSKIYAYNMSTKARDASKDFDTLSAARNNSPYGIWSDGTTMWVSDTVDDKIYAYNMSTKARDASKDFDTLITAGNRNPYGLWSDNTTMWVLDRDDHKIYAYNLNTKARDSSKDFNTLRAAGNRSPGGIWSDGTTMWVPDYTDNKIYAYNLRTKERDAPKDFDTLSAAGNTQPRGIWSDETTMWVSDTTDDKIYAYNLSTKRRDSSKDFNSLSPSLNTNPIGLWSNGTTMWVGDTVNDKIYAYDLSTKQRDYSKDFDTLITAGNRNPYGLWSDNTTMWVVDRDDDKIYAYNLSSKQRDSSKDFNTLRAAGNTNPIGLWSDGTTMWVGDDVDDKIYAYNLSTKERDASKDFDTLSAGNNGSPRGIWSDGTTMWVVDADQKIYAYNLNTKERDASKDFDTLSAAGNNNPYGVWSNGTTMWVVDAADYKIYAYNLLTSASLDFDRSSIASAVNSSDAPVTASGSGTISVNFSSSDNGYLISSNSLSGGSDSTGFQLNKDGSAVLNSATITSELVANIANVIELNADRITTGVLTADHIDSDVFNAEILYSSDQGEGAIGAQVASINCGQNIRNFDMLLLNMAFNEGTRADLYTATADVSNLLNSFQSGGIRRVVDQGGSLIRSVRVSWSFRSASRFQLWINSVNNNILNMRSTAAHHTIFQVIGIKTPS